MNALCFPPWRLAGALLTSMLATAAVAAPPIAWHGAWNDAVFAEAAQEHRFVLLDLHAVWCHWCHVMDQTTYADAEVVRLIGHHYVAVSVDADGDPALTSRYGDWGWPATIVLAADGTEIVNRRGYLPPQQMASLLQAIADEGQPLPEILLADWELSTAPIHIAIVGSKHDPAARALHAAALRYPADYLQAASDAFESRSFGTPKVNADSALTSSLRRNRRSRRLWPSSWRTFNAPSRSPSRATTC